MSLVGEIQTRKKKKIHSQPIEIMEALRKTAYTFTKRVLLNILLNPRNIHLAS